jgi:hypothetical protein
MVYIKRFVVVFCLISLTGCSTVGMQGRTFEEGYRTGVRENMADFATNFHGNDFPYFYWESPIVQDVSIPSHVENGMFVPAHNEPVVISPGEWRNRFAYPIRCHGKRLKSNEKEEEENYAFTNVDFSIRDITVLPQSFGCTHSSRKDKDPRQ